MTTTSIVEASAATHPRLVADIGGSNARFGWIDAPGARASHVQKLAVPDHACPARAVRAYLDRLSRSLGPACRPPRHAALAVATPVVADEISFTNSHWSFSRRQLQADLELRSLQVLNDFEALALSLPHLGPEQLRAHGVLPRAQGMLALVGPGRGHAVASSSAAASCRASPIDFLPRASALVSRPRAA